MSFNGKVSSIDETIMTGTNCFSVASWNVNYIKQCVHSNKQQKSLLGVQMHSRCEVYPPLVTMFYAERNGHIYPYTHTAPERMHITHTLLY